MITRYVQIVRSQKAHLGTEGRCRSGNGGLLRREGGDLPSHRLEAEAGPTEGEELQRWLHGWIPGGR